MSFVNSSLILFVFVATLTSWCGLAQTLNKRQWDSDSDWWKREQRQNDGSISDREYDNWRSSIESDNAGNQDSLNSDTRRTESQGRNRQNDKEATPYQKQTNKAGPRTKKRQIVNPNLSQGSDLDPNRNQLQNANQNPNLNPGQNLDENSNLSNNPSQPNRLQNVPITGNRGTGGDGTYGVYTQPYSQNNLVRNT
ncbi:unnamed protein product [Dicrocoelium dendriticum]|nr:unnamed protein product [Dicrocoelium dendriticum]